MSGRKLENVVVVQMPGRARCPVCVDGVFDGRQCPRCHGTGHEPFFDAAPPACGHEECGCTTMTMIGFADDAETQPVFECSNGRHTCVRFTDEEGRETVEVASDGVIGWGVLELLQGQKRLAGFISEAVIAGVPCLRVQVPLADDRSATIIYNASAMYSLTPTDEAVARVIAACPDAEVSLRAPELQRGHATPIVGGTSDAPPPEPGGAL